MIQSRIKCDNSMFEECESTMERYNMPIVFQRLQAERCINDSDILKTQDGFYLIYKSLLDILSDKKYI